MNELRVVLPGVQALFAFLLIVPFSDRFVGSGQPTRGLYIVALLAAALASVLFTAVPAFHRLQFRRHAKTRLLGIGNRCAIAGLFALGVAMVAAVALVVQVLFGALAATLVAGSVGIAIAVMWWALPLYVRRHDQAPASD